MKEEIDLDISKNVDSDFEKLISFIKNNYMQYISNIIINEKILQIKEVEKNVIISIEKENIYDEITVCYYNIHWHREDIEETISLLDDLIKNNIFTYVYYYNEDFTEKWFGGGTSDTIEEIIRIDNIIKREKPHKKTIETIKVKQWNKKERIFKRLDNKIFEEK